MRRLTMGTKLSQDARNVNNGLPVSLITNNYIKQLFKLFQRMNPKIPRNLIGAKVTPVIRNSFAFFFSSYNVFFTMPFIRRNRRKF